MPTWWSQSRGRGRQSRIRKIIYTFIHFPTNNFKFIKFHISQHIILCGNSDPLRLDLCRKLLRFVSLRADIVANMVEPAYPSLDQGGNSGFEGLRYDCSCRYIINPRRACAARVTVVVLCVCLSICHPLFSHYRLRGGL